MSKATHQAIPDERNASVEIYINGEFFAADEAKISGVRQRVPRWRRRLGGHSTPP